jgi:tetratricopeptide (TPR) repeat protein
MPGMSKQELKHDELADFLDQVGLWYHRNAKWIQWVVFAAIIAFIGVRLYDQYAETKAAKATAELGKAQSMLASALVERSDSKRKELFATAISEAERLAREYGNSFHGRQALLLLGNAHYYYSLALANQKSEASEQRKLARQAYEKFIAAAATPEEKATGQLALGNVLENELFASRDMALLKQAADAYNEVIKLVPESYLAAEAKLALARMYQPVPDKRSEAERLLTQVTESRSKLMQSPSSSSKSPDEEKGKVKRSSLKTVDEKTARDVEQFERLSYVSEAQRLKDSLLGFEPLASGK